MKIKNIIKYILLIIISISIILIIPFVFKKSNKNVSLNFEKINTNVVRMTYTNNNYFPIYYLDFFHESVPFLEFTECTEKYEYKCNVSKWRSIAYMSSQIYSKNDLIKKVRVLGGKKSIKKDFDYINIVESYYELNKENPIDGDNIHNPKDITYIKFRIAISNNPFHFYENIFFESDWMKYLQTNN